jgi:uncharacterized protein (TIGR02391 family)
LNEDAGERASHLEPRERLAIIKALVPKSGSQLESFFRAHDLGTAFRRSGDGAGKEQRINDALAEAEKRGDGDQVLRDAVRHFALADDEPPRPDRVKTATIPVTPFEVLRIQRLHPEVQAASADLLRDGHAGSAIFEAFKAVEVRVRDLSQIRGRSGKSLMAQAFRAEDPVLEINDGSTDSEQDEREGFQLIYMGAMQGIRNPKAHEVNAPLDPDRAFEYLALASLLMRRLDDAEGVFPK